MVVRDSRDNELARFNRSASVTCRARHAAILDGDRIALIVTNRRARIGLKPQAISRFDGSPPPAPKPVQLGRLDLLLGRTRRDPRSTKQGTPQ